MGFWKKWFGMRKIVIGGITLITLITAAYGIKRGIEEYKDWQKDPIVKATHVSLEEFISVVTHAEDAYDKKDSVEILLSYKDLLKLKPDFEENIFDEKRIGELVSKGAVSAANIDEMKSMSLRFNKIFPEIEKEAKKIESETK